jgi:hypothetical protein
MYTYSYNDILFVSVGGSDENRYLSKNSISGIEPNGFKGLGNVTRLFLDNNEINDTSLDALNSLPNLQWL